jgi:hypothetical protein
VGDGLSQRKNDEGGEMNKTTVLAALVVVLVVAVPASLAEPLQEEGRSGMSGQITVRSTEILKGDDVTNGGVAARGRFTISGVIADKGKVTDYGAALR